MGNRASEFAGKILYGVLFTVALPVLLVWWATEANHTVHLPPVHAVVPGLAIAVVGACLLVSGMYALWARGGGLPMNAYPPPKLVRDSIYAWVPHPVYAGFVLLCLGASLYSGSAAGFWLISPVVALSAAALVWGYENPDLRLRFPGTKREFLLGVPPGSMDAPSWQNRLAVYVLVLFPWWLIDALLGWTAAQSKQWPLFFWFPDDLWPDTWIPVFSVGAAIWVWLSPLIARTKDQLRQLCWSGLIGGGFLLYLYIVVPSAGQAHWLHMLRTGSLALHVLFSTAFMWLWLAAEVYRKALPRWQILIWVITAVLTAGVIFFSNDPLAHAITGGTALLAGLYYRLIWEFLRERAEIIANSWKEWHFGPVRVINHGFYAGAAAFTGVLLSGILAGESYVLGTVVFGVIGVVSAGLWGQFVEGSDRLKRPFGYYGSLLGAVVAILVLRWMGLDVWLMLAVFSVIMPWVQAIGRLRCLVNGCCHGAVSGKSLGIHYTHPRSRVCYLSEMKGKALHPTPLYSLLWLSAVGGFQLRLWYGEVEPSLLLGLYLILNGVGRFVEEAYRGEPQTPFFAGLRLYQWAAIVSVLTGVVVSIIPSARPALSPGLSWVSVCWAVIMWAFVQFLMGVDFPKSQRMFSRLA